MMNKGFEDIESLLPGFFSGEITEEDRAIVMHWQSQSPENHTIISEYQIAWEAMPLLTQMEQFNSFDALKKINRRIDKRKINWFVSLQRVAAILIIPLIVYTAFITYRFQAQNINEVEIHEEIWQTVKCRYGMVSHFSLPDGSLVWLNSGSSLQFPLQFNGQNREVSITGEAFFEVVKNPDQPFIVNARNLKLQVLGTSFNVINYEDEINTEVILVSGELRLLSQLGGNLQAIGRMVPNQRVIFGNESSKIIAQNVEVNKYISWREGTLAFVDETMEDVVKRLNRWYNTEIIIVDEEIEDYIYKATFTSEPFEKVLRLLKLSAPINYHIEPRKELPDGSFEKQKVYLSKKKKSLGNSNKSEMNETTKTE